MATNEYIISASNNVTYNSNTIGQIYYNTSNNTVHVSNGTHWQQAVYTTAQPLTYTTFNGDPSGLAQLGSRIFQSMEERIEYQQQAHLEPRDHAYNPDASRRCMDCYDHNLHRFEADKHLFVIDEEVPWSDLLAS
jgi:hypothetical protein